MIRNSIVRRLPWGVAAGIVLLIHGASAQRLAPHAGDIIRFGREIDIKVTLIAGEQISRFYGEHAGEVRFAVDSVAGNYVRWHVGSTTQQKMGMRDEMEGLREVLNKRVEEDWKLIATDTIGNPVDDPARRYLGGVGRVHRGVETRLMPAEWFLPRQLRKARKGTIAKLTFKDRVEPDDLKGGSTEAMDISYLLQLTHDGEADTLGVRTVRVQWKIENLEFTMTAIVGGEEVEQLSTGSSAGTAYYSLADGMLVAMRGEGRVSMAADPDDDAGASADTDMRFAIRRR